MGSSFSFTHASNNSDSYSAMNITKPRNALVPDFSLLINSRLISTQPWIRSVCSIYEHLNCI